MRRAPLHAGEIPGVSSLSFLLVPVHKYKPLLMLPGFPAVDNSGKNYVTGGAKCRLCEVQFSSGNTSYRMSWF
jgi:hypothetical protein